MEKRSTKASPLKVVQGGEAAVVKSTKALTRKDIKEFLAKFAEAILVDQRRVNKLPRKKFRPFDADGFWQRNREDHVRAIVDLSVTVDEMPKHLLKKLTDLAVGYKPEVVKQSLSNFIGQQAAFPSFCERATLFFSDLIEDVSQRGAGITRIGSPMEMMLRWFDYDDPIKIAEDCGYVDLLTSHIERESEERRRVLAAQSRLSFIEMRLSIGGYIEICDMELVQEGLRARSGRNLS
jgi:hypothetical protein